MSAKQLKLTLVKSRYGRLRAHQACVAGLGIKRLNQTVVVPNTPENRGMANRISYLLRIEEI